MLLFNAPKSIQGFTLIEMLVIVVIIGIMSAISVPSFLASLNRSKVNDGVAKVRGALQEAQREAIRKSRTCTVTFTTSSITGPCLVTGTRTLKDEVLLATNITGSQATFSFRGNSSMTLPSGVGFGKVVVYLSDGSGQKKCLAIANNIGIMRTGNYVGSTPAAADVTAGTCTTTQ